MANPTTYTFPAPGGGLTQHLHAIGNQQQADAINRAIDLNNEGMELLRRGHHEQAHQKLTQSLEIKERIHGHDNTMVALSLMNLGDNYLAWGKYDEAEQTGREALRIRRALNDPEARYSQELLDDVAEARRQAARTQTAAVATPSAGTTTAPTASNHHNGAGSSSSAAVAGAPSNSNTAAAGASGSQPTTASSSSSTQAAAGAAGSNEAAPGDGDDPDNDEPEDVPTVTCAACGARGVTRSADATPNLPYLKKCSACRTVRYCNKDCQAQDWQRHRAACHAAANA